MKGFMNKDHFCDGRMNKRDEEYLNKKKDKAENPEGADTQE